MNKITTYIYAIGNVEDLKEGDLDTLETQKKPDLLVKRLRKPSKFILPKFIGVYQSYDIKADTKEEKEIMDIERIRASTMDRIIEMSANLSMFSRFSSLDDINPKLIHILYDQDIWNAALVRESIQDNLGRVSLSELDNMPDFYEKDICLPREIFEKGNEAFKKYKDKKTTLNALAPYIKEFEHQRTTYGLTREEYAFLMILQQARCEPSKIISGERLALESATLLIEKLLGL